MRAFRDQDIVPYIAYDRHFPQRTVALHRRPDNFQASTMSIRRHGTVHDLAGLRLHPDGSRIQPSSSAAGSGQNVVPSIRQGPYMTQDVHGNWIATDAAGVRKIRKKKTVPYVSELDAHDHEENKRKIAEGGLMEEIGFAQGSSRRMADDDEDGGEVISDAAGNMDPRRQRRIQFERDFSYLNFGSNSQTSMSRSHSPNAENSGSVAEQGPIQLPLPSSVSLALLSQAFWLVKVINRTY